MAEAAGIVRATLHRYFADVDAILVAWRERHVERHLAELADVRGEESRDRLAAVLETDATMQHARAHGEIAAHLHQRSHVADAEQRLKTFLTSCSVKR